VLAPQTELQQLASNRITDYKTKHNWATLRGLATVAASWSFENYPAVPHSAPTTLPRLSMLRGFGVPRCRQLSRHQYCEHY
jgi:hypothetical protein